MDQDPEAHCWKLVPPMQLNWPSVVQGPVWAPVEPVAGAAGAAGADADGAGAGAAGATEGAAEGTGTMVMLGTAVPEIVTAEGTVPAGTGAGVGIVGGGMALPAEAAGAAGVAGAAGATALLQ